jgi:membrane-bound lytic murein transglycosylase D
MRFKKAFIIVASILILFLVVFIFTFFKTITDSTDGDYTEIFQRKYSVFALNLPEHLTFAGEEVPLDYFDVRESLDRELLVNTYWQSQTLLFMKRAKRYFPEIERILKENGIPDDFKYLVLAESDLINQVSPAGAVGIWQLLKGTAQDYGLEVNDVVDERYHFEKAAKAACMFINDSKELFGSWTMAAAAYNMGRKGLARQVNRQYQNNYYELLFSEETARYVFRMLAIKLILENPEEYGFHVREKDLYHPIPTYEVTVDTSITNFGKFAEKFEINYKILKYFNPWLRDTFLLNKNNKVYTIKIPEKGYRSYSKIIDQIKIDTTFVKD